VLLVPGWAFSDCATIHLLNFGEYLVVDNNQKLAFTWILENQACEGGEGQLTTTLVESDFVSEGFSTRLILKHEKLLNPVFNFTKRIK